MLNVHPILVHFPIALFTVYAAIEVARIHPKFRTDFWYRTKALLAITGSLGADAAYLAGNAIKPQFQSALTDVHQQWATGTLIIVALIAAIYILSLLYRSQITGRWEQSRYAAMQAANETAAFCDGLVRSGAFMGFLAVVGLTAVTVTGALGGALALGPDVDPFARFVFDLLVKSSG